MEDYLTKRQVALLLKVADNTIDNLVDEHGLPVLSRSKKSWKFDKDEVLKWAAARSTASETDLGTSYAAARTRKMQAEAERIELELELIRKQQIKIEDAIAVVEQEYSNVRGKLKNLPSRITKSVFGLKDIHQVEETIERIVEEVIAELRGKLIN
jgi:septal ring factor EnvC (AmiA/AmiB activator)